MFVTSLYINREKSKRLAGGGYLRFDVATSHAMWRLEMLKYSANLEQQLADAEYKMTTMDTELELQVLYTTSLTAKIKTLAEGAMGVQAMYVRNQQSWEWSKQCVASLSAQIAFADDMNAQAQEWAYQRSTSLAKKLDRVTAQRDAAEENIRVLGVAGAVLFPLVLWAVVKKLF